MFGAYSLALQRISDILSQRDYHLNLALRCELVGEKGRRKLPRMFDEVGIEGFLVIQAPGPDLARGLEAQNVSSVILEPELVVRESSGPCLDPRVRKNHKDMSFGTVRS